MNRGQEVPMADVRYHSFYTRVPTVGVGWLTESTRLIAVDPWKEFSIQAPYISLYILDSIYKFFPIKRKTWHIWKFSSFEFRLAKWIMVNCRTLLHTKIASLSIIILIHRQQWKSFGKSFTFSTVGLQVVFYSTLVCLYFLIFKAMI